MPREHYIQETLPYPEDIESFADLAIAVAGQAAEVGSPKHTAILITEVSKFDFTPERTVEILQNVADRGMPLDMRNIRRHALGGHDQELTGEDGEGKLTRVNLPKGIQEAIIRKRALKRQRSNSIARRAQVHLPRQDYIPPQKPPQHGR
ncbi:MAG TPA: hypothetical protein VFI84_01845 [Candidatus Saccharimonadales bacterium]|nr:hypothetical protein [Candidatus Saccharimonadales bacterium]